MVTVDEMIPCLAVAGAVLAINTSRDPLLRDVMEMLPYGWDAYTLREDITHALDGRAQRPSEAQGFTDAYVAAYDRLGPLT